jgi:hypothetical protein
MDKWNEFCKDHNCHVDEIPRLDMTMNGVPVEMPKAFWALVWKEVVTTMLEEFDKKE